jgi:hypothetical protein
MKGRCLSCIIGAVPHSSCTAAISAMSYSVSTDPFAQRSVCNLEDLSILDMMPRACKRTHTRLGSIVQLCASCFLLGWTPDAHLAFSRTDWRLSPA